MIRHDREEMPNEMFLSVLTIHCPQCKYDICIPDPKELSCNYYKEASEYYRKELSKAVAIIQKLSNGETL